MDQLLPLIEKFKDMTSEAVLNEPKIRALNMRPTTNIIMKSAFETMSTCLNILNAKLTQSEQESYITIARELFEQLQNLDKLLFDPQIRITTSKSVSDLFMEIALKADAYMEELRNPSLFTVKIGKTFKKINYLPVTPYSVFWKAVYSLNGAVMNPLKSSYLRRLAMVSMSGGIPVDLLRKRELSGFAFKPQHFQSYDLQFNHPEDDSFREAFTKAKEIVERFSKQCHSTLLNEATLRMMLWDPIVCLLRSLFLISPGVIVSEYSVGTVLQLDSPKIIDLSVVYKDMNIPIFSMEAALKYLEKAHRHKDFTKLCCMMTSSVARESEYFESNGWDPMLARAFGIWIGGSGFQFVVAHPVVDNEDAECFNCYVSITSKEYWLSDLLQPILQNQTTTTTTTTTTSTAAPRPARHGTNQVIGPDHIPAELEINNRDAHHRNPTIANVNLEESYAEEVAVAPDDPAATTITTDPTAGSGDIMLNPLVETPDSMGVELKQYSFEEMIIFFKHLNDHLELIDDLSTSRPRRPDPPSSPRKRHVFQTNSYVPSSADSSTLVTPPRGRMGSVQRGTGQLSEARSPTRQGQRPQRALIRKPFTYEYTMYTTKMKFNSVFPLVYHSKIVDDPDNPKNAMVEYVFEFMDPLLEGEGDDFGIPSFGSVVRADSFDSLLLEAATFALHTLYGLYILHESLQVVHSDISPENVMFSHVGNCWKLNDFGSALPLVESLKTVRTVGTPRFIAPESAETGIFTKESDVFSLGSVLFLTFHLKLMFFLEMGDDVLEDYEEDEFGYNPRIKGDYDEFFGIVRKMIQEDAGARAKVIDSMSDFLRLFERIRPSDHETGNDIIPRIKALIEEPRGDLEEIPLQPIT